MTAAVAGTRTVGLGRVAVAAATVAVPAAAVRRRRSSSRPAGSDATLVRAFAGSGAPS